MIKMSYSEWKQRFEDASNTDHKAWMRCCELDDAGKSDTPDFRRLEAQQRDYAEVKQALMNAHPDYERRRLSESR